VGGACPEVIGESENSGRVGTEATLTLVSGAFPLKGDYTVMWSKTPISEETECVVVAEGRLDELTTELTFSFTIPEASYGTNYLQFRRAQRPEDPYGFIFNVRSDVKTSPSPTSPGSTVTVNGTGFPAGDDIKLSFDGKATDIEITTSSKGSFTADFTVTDTIAGSHSFEAAAKSTTLAKATASFEVVPGISLEPEFPGIGQEVTITGHGFAASSLVTIEYDDIAIADSPTTDEAGNFTHTFKVPETSESTHSVVASDGAGNKATFGMPLEGAAPPAPATISPTAQRFGWLGSKLVLFKWTEVADPSGITYILEIADNLNFFPLAPGMRKAGLTQPTCLVNVEPGTHYWRVKAVDGAGNESAWTLSPQPFKVGFFSTLYLVIGGFICIIIIVFVIRGFSRRVSQYY